MSAAVEVTDLVKRYGTVEAVRGVSLTVAAGEIVGVLGPNGAGKTSTLECIIGLRQADGGSIRVCGIDARRDASAMRERIGVQLQSTSLPEHLRVREALVLFASFYRRSVTPATLIERFSLAEKADAPFASLSGGQKQRLGLALAMINEPDVLFLDEPTAGMDPQARRELHDAIRAMKAGGRSVLITTHYIEEAEELCDRIAIVDHGKVIACDTPAALVARSAAVTRVVCTTDRPLIQAGVAGLEGAGTVEITGNTARITSTAINRTVIALVHHLEAVGATLVDLQIRKPSLEDVFIELTGRRLRIEDARMHGFWRHFLITLVLNARNRQALIFGYVVPVFFLIAFAAIFTQGKVMAASTIAPLIVISVLGGACFGMPITLVNERDRGVWRRYRLTPLGAGTFISSTMASRFVLVTSSVALQLALAMWVYNLGWPKQPIATLVAFGLTGFAFIGIGLIIAAIASNIGAVQALGQSLFLPMIMIGGVGVPIRMLPPWAQDVSLFLPGRYAMELLERCYATEFDWDRFKWRALILFIIGASATLAGWKLFRWESDQRLGRGAWWWVGLALATWIAAGVLAKVVKLG